MLILLEVVGSISGIVLMFCALFHGDWFFLWGLLVLIFTYIFTSIGHFIKMKAVEDEVLSEGGDKNDPKIIKAKADFAGSLIRTTIVGSGAYRSVKGAAKHIAHPEHWDEV